MKWLRSLTVPHSSCRFAVFRQWLSTARDGSSVASARPQPPSIALPLASLRKTLKLTTTQPGRIEAFEEAPLYPKLAGYVQQVLVDIGDSVKKISC